MIFRIIISFLAAIFMGKLVSKFRIPSILGWLLAGMIMGPYGLNILSDKVLTNEIFVNLQKFFECSLGFMIGTELLIKKLKKSGKALFVTTIFQSVGTYLFVALVFSTIFYFMKLPIYLGFIFGGIALATAPAPALAIVSEFKTKGPVTDALIPMAALDDVVAVIFFFTTLAIVINHASGKGLSLGLIPIMIFLPILIGVATGFLTGIFLRKSNKKSQIYLSLLFFIILTVVIGIYFNVRVFKSSIINFVLMGMAGSCTFSNMIPEKKLTEIMRYFEPVLTIGFILVIMCLGAPLDYKLITGAGIFTAVYILSRAFGKYFGARLGAKVTHMGKSVEKYLGLTLLPHSGVSLIFTGISATSLMAFDPHSSEIIRGTIAAAAIINEIIAVIVAKYAFMWAKETYKR